MSGDTGNDVGKNGISKTGTIAIITALITAGTTISVAYITKSDSGSKPAAASAASVPAASASYAQPVPAPGQAGSGSAVNITGQWRNPNSDETISFTQNGPQLQAQMISASLEMNVPATGSISGNQLQWTAMLQNGFGQTVTLECKGTVFNDASIQGVCAANGQKSSVVYVK